MNKIDVNILLIDDEIHLLNALKTILSKFIKNVHAKECAQEALDFFNENKENVDLIITDLNMPKMNGYEFVSKVRETCDNTVVYLSSGDDDDKNFDKMQSLNIKRKLLKPTSIDLILENIKLDFNTK